MQALLVFSPNFVPQGDTKNGSPASSPPAPILISDNLPSRCSDLYLPSPLAVNYGKKMVKRRQKDENDSKTTRKREWTHSDNYILEGTKQAIT